MRFWPVVGLEVLRACMALMGFGGAFLAGMVARFATPVIFGSVRDMVLRFTALSTVFCHSVPFRGLRAVLIWVLFVIAGLSGSLPP